MSGICGWLDLEARAAPDPGVTKAMAGTITRFDASRSQIACNEMGCVAVAGKGGTAHLSRVGEFLAGVWGAPKVSDPELSTLARARGSAYAIAKGYALRGPDVLQAVAGSFAIAILDGAGKRAFLAGDRLGTRPLYYATPGRKLIFGSTLDAISAFPGVGTELSPQSLYEYVYFHAVPAPQTIYADRDRLLPGTHLTYSAAGVKLTKYWQISFSEQERRPFPELKKEFITVLRAGVAACVEGERNVGAFLSGGTDSSTMAGLLRDVTQEAPRTYSIGFDEPGFDEISYARLAARHFGSRHHEHYVTPRDVVAAIPMIAEVHDQPFGNSSAVPTYYCAKLAKSDGVETLIGGDGGDELFGGNERYAKQYVYSLYSDLPHALRERILEPIAFSLPAALAGKAQRYIRHASAPMPARYDNYNLVEYLGAPHVFHREFLAAVDQAKPRAAMANEYWDSRAKSLINRMLAFDLKYTLADNDLPKVTRSSELAGVEARFPMLDDGVVAFAARLEPRLKLKRTQLRYFFKQALRDYLPAAIIGKKKHGFGLPFGRWLETNSALREMALDSLSDVRARSIFRSAFIDELSAVHIGRHADYFGTMVWVMMMLEQWFKRAPGSHSERATAEAASAAVL